jgi:hypothetical protein
MLLAGCDVRASVDLFPDPAPLTKKVLLIFMEPDSDNAVGKVECDDAMMRLPKTRKMHTRLVCSNGVSTVSTTCHAMMKNRRTRRRKPNRSWERRGQGRGGGIRGQGRDLGHSRGGQFQVSLKSGSMGHRQDRGYCSESLPIFQDL